MSSARYGSKFATTTLVYWSQDQLPDPDLPFSNLSLSTIYNHKKKGE